MKSVLTIITALIVCVSMNATTIYCKAIGGGKEITVQVFDQDGNNVTGCVVVEASKTDTICTVGKEFRLNVCNKTLNKDEDTGYRYTVVLTGHKERQKYVYIDAHDWTGSSAIQLEMWESDAYAYGGVSGVEWAYVHVDNLYYICDHFANINTEGYIEAMGAEAVQEACESCHCN